MVAFYIAAFRLIARDDAGLLPVDLYRPAAGFDCASTGQADDKSEVVGLREINRYTGVGRRKDESNILQLNQTYPRFKAGCRCNSSLGRSEPAGQGVPEFFDVGRLKRGKSSQKVG